jgi:hypothetical protein
VQLFIPVGTAASTSSTTNIPANAVVTRAAINVEVAYSDETTITVGRAGSLSLLMGTADSQPDAINLYDAPQTTQWGGSSLPVVITIAGAPGVGSSHVLVEYSVPGS